MSADPDGFQSAPNERMWTIEKVLLCELAMIRKLSTTVTRTITYRIQFIQHFVIRKIYAWPKTSSEVSLFPCQIDSRMFFL